MSPRSQVQALRRPEHLANPPSIADEDRLLQEFNDSRRTPNTPTPASGFGGGGAVNALKRFASLGRKHTRSVSESAPRPTQSRPAYAVPPGVPMSDDSIARSIGMTKAVREYERSERAMPLTGGGPTLPRADVILEKSPESIRPLSPARSSRSRARTPSFSAAMQDLPPPPIVPTHVRAPSSPHPPRSRSPSPAPPDNWIPYSPNLSGTGANGISLPPPSQMVDDGGWDLANKSMEDAAQREITRQASMRSLRPATASDAGMAGVGIRGIGNRDDDRRSTRSRQSTRLSTYDLLSPNGYERGDGTFAAQQGESPQIAEEWRRSQQVR